MLQNYSYGDCIVVKGTGTHYLLFLYFCMIDCLDICFSQVTYSVSQTIKMFQVCLYNCMSRKVYTYSFFLMNDLNTDTLVQFG